MIRKPYRELPELDRQAETVREVLSRIYARRREIISTGKPKTGFSSRPRHIPRCSPSGSARRREKTCTQKDD